MSRGERCRHSWESLNRFVGNRVVDCDGTETRLADVAWCSRCGEAWDLDAGEVAAVNALTDGHFLTARLKAGVRS